MLVNAAEQPVSRPPKAVSVPTIMHGTRNIDETLATPDRLAHKKLEFVSEDPSLVWTDITPEYFEFNNFDAENFDKMVSLAVTRDYNGFSYRGGRWLSNTFLNNSKYDMSKGVLFFSGGSVHDNFGMTDGIRDQRATFIEGMQIVDFGDEVGRVLAFNGVHSTLNDSLKGGYFLENFAPKNSSLINYDTSKGGNTIEPNDYTLLFFPVDRAKYLEVINGNGRNKEYTIRVRFEFNTFCKSSTDVMKAMGDVTGVIEDYEQDIRLDHNHDWNIGVMMRGDGQCYEHPSGQWCWDGTKWFTYEVNLLVSPDYYDSGELTDAVPCVKVQFANFNLINLGAHFIRNVQMFITEGNIPSTSPSYLPDYARIDRRNYYLRPSAIALKHKKLYVGEPDYLQAGVMPTWATQDIYWVLVDDEDSTISYRTLEEIPAENPIRDRIEYFDSETGRIVPKKNGTVRVQAISKAEGVNSTGVEVEKVMSCVTELPIFDVVYGIDLNHEHHQVDNLGIELSGSESTRVEYVLKTKKGVVNPKFDPETPLTLAVSGNYLSADKERYQHGFNYTEGYFDGKGWIDIFLDEGSAKEDGALTLVVNDGRENRPMYSDGQLDREYGSRQGVANLLHYAKPHQFRIANYIETTGSSQASLFETDELGQWIWLPAGVNGDSFVIEPLLLSMKDRASGIELNAKQIYAWEIDESTNPSGKYVKMEQTDDGRIKLTPNISPDVKQYLTYIHFTPYYAGTHKSSQVKEEELSALSSEQALGYELDNDFFDNADSDDPVYLPYGPDWQKQFTPVEAATHEEKVGDVQSVLIEMTNTGTTTLESVDADGTDSPAEFYNLKGVKTANPSNGVYIIRQGMKTKSVIIP